MTQNKTGKRVGKYNKYLFYKRKWWDSHGTLIVVSGIMLFLISMSQQSFLSIDYLKLKTWFEWKVFDVLFYSVIGILVGFMLFLRFYPEEKFKDSLYNEIRNGMIALQDSGSGK